MQRRNCRMEWISRNGRVPRLSADGRYRIAEDRVDTLRSMPQASLVSSTPPMEVDEWQACRLRKSCKRKHSSPLLVHSPKWLSFPTGRSRPFHRIHEGPARSRGWSGQVGHYRRAGCWRAPRAKDRFIREERHLVGSAAGRRTVHNHSTRFEMDEHNASGNRVRGPSG
jgi:hypothetical protein